jgi:hypothetical protein
VQLARSFLRRFISCRFAHRVSGSDRVLLSADLKADLRWWCEFAERWNGVEMMEPNRSVSAPSDLQLFTDASGGMVGGFFAPDWFQLPIPSRWLSCSIGEKELLAVVVAAFTWGVRLRGMHVSFRVDNESARAAVNSRSSRHPGMMALIRALLFAACSFHFSFDAFRVPGVDNAIADALSRDLVSRFRALAPQASEVGSIPVLPPADIW